jgi:hypothetical protein
VAAQGVGTRVKVLLTIPVEVHSRLLGLCDVSSQEYLTLANGVVDEHGAAICILCNSDYVKTLLIWVSIVEPEAVSQITVELDPKE